MTLLLFTLFFRLFVIYKNIPSYTVKKRSRPLTVFIGGNMEESPDYTARVKKAAVYIIENKATIRSAARYVGVSKSTLHKDISERLPLVAPELCPAIRKILDINRAERHIRGGIATRNKYLKLHSTV